MLFIDKLNVFWSEKTPSKSSMVADSMGKMCNKKALREQKTSPRLVWGTGNSSQVFNNEKKQPGSRRYLEYFLSSTNYPIVISTNFIDICLMLFSLCCTPSYLCISTLQQLDRCWEWISKYTQKMQKRLIQAVIHNTPISKNLFNYYFRQILKFP